MTRVPSPKPAARKPIRVATWNINSVRLRHPLLKELVAALDPDVLCLQETKCPEEHFPLEDLRAHGFAHVAHRGMKGYNGVAVLSRHPLALRHGDPDWCGKGDCRHLGVDVDAPGGPLELGRVVDGGGRDRAVPVVGADDLPARLGGGLAHAAGQPGDA